MTERRKRQQAPDVTSLEPQMMSARELREKLEELFDWLHYADAAKPGEQPPAEAVARVRDAANMLLQERRLRHSDERAPRGG